MDVVVGEVELSDPRAGQRQVVLGPVALDELVLGDPVDLPVHQGQVPGLHRCQGATPQLEHARDRGVPPALGDEVHGFGVVLPLDLQGTGLAAVGELDLAPTGQVVADLPDGPDRVLQREVAHRHARLDHP